MRGGGGWQAASHLVHFEEKGRGGKDAEIQYIDPNTTWDICPRPAGLGLAEYP